MVLAALPTISPGVQQITIRVRVTELTRGLLQDIGIIQRSLREDLGTVPRLVNEANFSSTIQLMGTFGYNALGDFENAYRNTLVNVAQEIENLDPDPHDAQELRGLGGFADRAAEQLNWSIPTDFAKDLAMSLRRTRFNVEYFDNQLNDFRTTPAAISVQVFPRPKDNLFFTELETPGDRVRIGGIVGGSFTKFNAADAITTACVFGVGPPSTLINVEADGDPDVSDSTTSDLDGDWSYCFTTLKQDYYRFTASDSDTSDTAEQGFFVRFQF
jgi:hypothetical protein